MEMLRVIRGMLSGSPTRSVAGSLRCRPSATVLYANQRMAGSEAVPPPEGGGGGDSSAQSDVVQSEGGREVSSTDRPADSPVGGRTPESALLLAAQRRRAISEAGGFTHIIVKEERFTDVSQPRKRRQRAVRPWVGAYKPVILRRNTIMPTRETTVEPLPKIVLSPQWPLVYRQKIFLEAELEFAIPDEYDPENPPPHMLQSQFFPRYMRFFSVLVYFTAFGR